MTSAEGTVGRADVARCWAGFASIGAGLIHLAVTQDHFEEWWLYGLFFLSVGGTQIGWAVLALEQDRPPIPRLTAAANLAVVVLWAVTRTSGLPVGPEPWTPEPLGRADLLASVLEVVVAGALMAAIWLAAADRRRPPDRRPKTWQLVTLMFAGAVAVAALTTPALADTPLGGGGGHGHSDAD